jgi:hypothetical protein
MSIPRASRGQPITADLINSIIDEINKNNLVSISGGKLNKSINGTTISVSSSPPLIQPDLPPFYYSTATGGSGVYFRLNAGTINNYLPDNMFSSVQLSATTPASGDLNYVYLDCTTDGSAILSSTIAASSTAPDALTDALGSAPATLQALLYVVRGSQPYRVIGPSSLVARVVETRREVKTSITLMDFPFNIYYSWAIFS